MIDWTSFSPYSALLGGMLIGASAAGFWWLLGKIAGISGLLAGSIWRQPGQWQLAAAFIAGLLLAGWLSGSLPKVTTPSGWPNPALMVLAGLLVGYGTRLGNGCTSGHGVCGLSRGSRRSLVATLCFMASAMLTATLLALLNH